jgi:hypothetical protein
MSITLTIRLLAYLLICQRVCLHVYLQVWGKFEIFDGLMAPSPGHVTKLFVLRIALRKSIICSSMGVHLTGIHFTDAHLIGVYLACICYRHIS